MVTECATPIQYSQTSIGNSPYAGDEPTSSVDKCGCKGIRFCAACVHLPRVVQLRRKFIDSDRYERYTFCYYDVRRRRAVRSDSLNILSTMDDIRLAASNDDAADPPEEFVVETRGLHFFSDFILPEEEEELIRKIEGAPWILSQSGRRKQDYGPKVNFKKQNLKMDSFIGLPDYAQPLIDRINRHLNEERGDCGQKRSAVVDICEVCNLEYVEDRHSSIEMHKDDEWIWGEHLISINLLSDSIITFESEEDRRIIFVYLPRRSMLCMTSDLRYKYLHGIFPYHICRRRIAVTMREVADSFKEGGELYELYGRELTERAKWRVASLVD